MFKLLLVAVLVAVVLAKIPSHPKALKSVVDIRGGADSLGPIDAEVFKKMNIFANAAYAGQMLFAPEFSSKLYLGIENISAGQLEMSSWFGLALASFGVLSYFADADAVVKAGGICWPIYLAFALWRKKEGMFPDWSGIVMQSVFTIIALYLNYA